VDEALSKCSYYSGTSCVIEMSFENQCGSLARKSDNYQVVAAGWSDDSRREAGNNALASCGEGRELVTTVCSNE